MNELPDNNYDEARRWLRNTADDLHVMRLTVEDPESPARMTCFFAHLVVEKCLKAVLIDAGAPFEKTHDLVGLYERCVREDRLAGLDADTLESLNPWAIDGRYADDLVEAGRATATRLAAFAEEVFVEVRRELEADGGDQ